MVYYCHQKNTSERNKSLIQKIGPLAEKGNSSGQIGLILGLTRNQVIGLCHRNGIKLHGSAGAKTKETIKELRDNSDVWKTTEVKRKTDIALVKSFHTSVDVMTNSPCLWPDKCDAKRPTLKRPYCEAHNKIAFVPERTKKRSAV